MNAPDAPFDAPWQAQLFGLTVAMNEAGHFTWAEWAAVFGPNVQNTSPDAYWSVWSDALISVLESKNIAASAEVCDLTHQWQTAARATPHGEPIELLAANTIK